MCGIYIMDITIKIYEYHVIVFNYNSLPITPVVFELEN